MQKIYCYKSIKLLWRIMNYEILVRLELLVLTDALFVFYCIFYIVVLR